MILRCAFPCKVVVADCKINHATTLRTEKKYTPPPWHPSSLNLSPDPEVTKQKKLWCIQFLGKTREKGIHHSSGNKGIHHRGHRPRKRKRGVVYSFSSLLLVGGLSGQPTNFKTKAKQFASQLILAGLAPNTQTDPRLEYHNPSQQASL